jgi:phage shock protein A
MQQRVVEMEAEAAAVTEVLEEPKQPEKDIADIETAAQVEDALAALKTRLASRGPASSTPINA